jgi:hypothetical protein
MPVGWLSRSELIQAPERGAGTPVATRLLTAAALTLTLVPLVVVAVAIVAKFGTHYMPVGDNAGIETHVRDVGHHPVLLGLYSRDRWSHPGPAMFYALAVPYRLSGGSSLSLNIGALLINGASIAALALIARRHGGVPIMLLTLVGCGLLVHSFGPFQMSSPWNPDLPVFPFAVVIFLTWAMLCGDVWALPVGAAVTTFCVQTHIGYMLLAVPVFLLGVGGLMLSARRRRVDTHPSRTRRGFARAGGLTGLVLAVMWLPPVVQQINHSSAGHHGNLGNIVDYFTHPSEPLRHSFLQGYRLITGQFALAPGWLRGRRAIDVFVIEPALLRTAPFPIWLFPFVLAVAVLWWQRAVVAKRLALIVSVLLVLGVVWVARTPGTVYAYRIGWTWIVAMMVFLLIAWALWTLVSDLAPRFAGQGLVGVCSVALLVLAVINAQQGARIWPDGRTRVLQSLNRQVVSHLPKRSGDVIVRCDGDESCIYAVGLFLALEKRGLHARADTPTGVVSSDAEHFLHTTGPVRATLTVKIDDRFDAQQRKPGAQHLVAYWGDQPASVRAQVDQQSVALDEAYKAGTIDATGLFIGKGRLLPRGNAVGVFIEDPSRRP